MITIEIKETKKCNGDFSMFLTFPYDNYVINSVRSLPERYWDNESKTWEVPVKKFGVLLESLSDYEIEIKADDISNLLPKPQEIKHIDFNFKTNPFNHQIEGFEYGVNHDRWLLGDEQGLGKTKQVIDIACARKESNTHCLIVCGVNGLKWNWLNEISTHSDETGYILGQKIKGGKLTIGSNKDKLNDLYALENENLGANPYFIITNVESLRDKEISAKISEFCDNGLINIMAIDEVHKCKNPSSQQGKGILKCQPKVRIAMSGTPLMNNPMDLYIILKWLGYEKHSFYSFKQHYCVMGGFGGYQVVGYRHLDELQEQLNDIMLRRLKADVLDLPEKLYIDEYVDMSPKQAQIYKEISSEIKSNIDLISTKPNPLAELIRMRQATGYTGILSSTIQESAKLDRLEDLVEDITSNGEKVVIFSNWTQMTDVVCDRLANYNPLVITGETKDDNRQMCVDKFQNDSNSKVIVGTIGAMGTGLTLTAANTVIFLDEPWTMANKQQAIDRCHRIGTSKNVTIYTMLCKNTIDERIHDIVEKKGMMSDALVDGKVVGDKVELLDYLLS